VPGRDAQADALKSFTTAMGIRQRVKHVRAIRGVRDTKTESVRVQRL